MKNFRSLFILVLAVSVLAGCNPLKKMQKNASLINYEVTPGVLETHGGEVAISIKGVFPEKYFDKNTTAEAVPVLVYDGGEVAFENVALQGEKIVANSEVINYAGDNFSYNSKVAYKDEMKKSELMLRLTATRKGKSVTFDPIKLADGVIATSTLTEAAAKPVMLKDNFVRIIPESKMADINYQINKFDIRSDELKAEDVVLLKEYINTVSTNENLLFKGVSVSSYASPDGKIELNEKLSANRGVAADKLMKSNFSKIEDINKEGFFSSLVTAEDWDGFKKEVEASTIQDKDLILRVLSMHSDPEIREREIKNMSAAFEALKTDILPKLRRSKLIVNVDKVGRTDEEILGQMKADPSVLTLEEMLYSATLTTDAEEQLKFYQAAFASFPTCFRAANNIGYTYVKLGKADEAIAAFDKAKAIQNNDVVKNNTAYAYFLKGDYAKAEELFTSMTAATADSKFGLGMIAVVNGEYDKAVNYFGTEVSYNLGHALLLKKDYTKAKAILDQVPACKCGKPSYLKAVLGARMDNKDYMLNNLREAVGYNAEWKEYAKTDLEFAKFFNDSTFISVIQ